MITLHKYKLKKDDEREFALKNQLFGTADGTDSLLLPKKLNAFKKAGKEILLIKRISPFLVASFCLSLLFTYLVIKDQNDKWLLLFLFAFIESNILIIDFALKNYYEGRTKLSIWIIEMILIFIAGYFLLRQSL